MNARDARPRDPCGTVRGDLQSRHGRLTPGGHALQPRVERGGHAYRVRLGKLRSLASEEFIDRGAPQPQPPLEMTGPGPDARVQIGVRAKGPPAVGATPEQHRLPK